MFEKILFPTDGSDVTEKALAYLIGLRGAGARQVVLLQVVSDRNVACVCKGLTLFGKQGPKDFEQARQALHEEALRMLKPLEAELREAGFQVDLRIESGVTKVRILKIAKLENVSAIVLGSHGRGNLSSALLGSVSDYVIRHSPKPVLVIKRASKGGTIATFRCLKKSLSLGEVNMLQKILYPTDFSDVSQKALNYVKGLKAAGTTEVVLLRVISDKSVECIGKGIALAGNEVADFLSQAFQSLQEEARQQIRPVEDELKTAGFDVTTRIESGVPQTRILEIATEEKVSAIVLGSHGRSNLSSALLGSVSDHVIRHANQPVLVVKRN